MGNGNAFGACFCFLVLAGLAIGLAYYFTEGFTGQPSLQDIGNDIQDGINDLGNIWPSLDHYFEEDPFNATTPEEADRWENDGNGLELKILNAMDESWWPYFDTAVSDWDNGNPDTLTLSTETVTAESECTQVDGVMKVCNGDYGDTQWRGLNTCLIVDGIITSSVAQMNEFYLADANDAWHQYTACHEIGHGFGLPHTDESFWNEDLGNCLDYTENPQNNMHPDTPNFEFLEAMYGTVPGYDGGEATAAPAQAFDDGSNSGTRSRLLRTSRTGRTATARRQKTPDWVMDRIRSINALMLQQRGEDGETMRMPQTSANFAADDSGGSKNGGWRLLRRTPAGDTHEIDIGEGYSVVVHRLLAS